MKKIKFSVIVPVYNAEKYIGRCIESILNQTCNDLELILVDDGSPDNSPQICDKYAENDSRVKVIHKKNGYFQEIPLTGKNFEAGKAYELTTTMTSEEETPATIHVETAGSFETAIRGQYGSWQ